MDAGEIGADHSVTALYELKLHDDADNDDAEGILGTVFLRYQDPDTSEVLEISRTLQQSELSAGFEDASARFQLAAVVAEYAEILRESYWAQDGNLEDVVAQARRVQGLLPRGSDVAEFADLTPRTLSVHDSARR